VLALLARRVGVAKFSAVIRTSTPLGICVQRIFSRLHPTSFSRCGDVRVCSPRWAYCAGIAIDLCRVTEAMARIFASSDRSTKTSLERAQERLDRRPDARTVRRSTVQHPFAIIKAAMGATHFKMKTLKHVATEMALHVLAYNLKRVMVIISVQQLLRAI